MTFSVSYTYIWDTYIIYHIYDLVPKGVQEKRTGTRK